MPAYLVSPALFLVGVEANREELDLLIGYAVDQGILNRRLTPGELFQVKRCPLTKA